MCLPSTDVHESMIALFVDFGECGESAQKQRGRILSGDQFEDRVQWPWQAAIFRDSEFPDIYRISLHTFLCIP